MKTEVVNIDNRAAIRLFVKMISKIMNIPNRVIAQLKDMIIPERVNNLLIFVPDFCNT
jgi:hypothetical protein